MDQIEEIHREFRSLGSLAFDTQLGIGITTIYARIATGEGMNSGGKLGTIMKNPGFAFGRARKASQTAYDSFAKLSANLPPDLEGFRFGIEFGFAKLLIKRKEPAEARKHLEKAIAFLQPLGDTVGMRDCPRVAGDDRSEVADNRSRYAIFRANTSGCASGFASASEYPWPTTLSRRISKPFCSSSARDSGRLRLLQYISAPKKSSV